MNNVLKVVKFVLSTGLIQDIFLAERNHGAGKGDDKLAEVLDKMPSLDSELQSSVSSSELADAAHELVDALVDVLNAIGVLDNVPGYKVDIVALANAAVRLVKAVNKLAELFR